MRGLLLLGLAVLLSACGPTSSPPTAAGSTPSPAHASPSPAASAAPLGPTYGILVDGNSPQEYTVSLVGLDGKSAAHVTARQRSQIQTAAGAVSGAAAVVLPPVAASDRLLYYLDGDTDVYSMAPGAAPRLVTHVGGSTSVHAAFAISPDDSRIAISLLDYSTTPPTVSLYVRPLADSGAGTKIFESTTSYVWPVGWHGSNLVLAVSGAAFTQQAPANPYGAFGGYHVADPAGTRVATLCAGGQATGPVTPAGDLCYAQGGAVVESWDGHVTKLPGAGVQCFALSADGTKLGCADNMATPPAIEILPMSGPKATSTGASGTPTGWLDNSHLLYATGGSGPATKLHILDTTTDASTDVSAAGTLIGLLPGSL